MKNYLNANSKYFSQRICPQFFLFFLPIFILFQYGTIKGQCDPPWALPTVTCEDAPLICLENACYTSLNIPFACCNGWCGPNTIINNPMYFKFIASAENVSLEIHVDFCGTGQGLQSAILDACFWDNSNVLDCNPGTPPGGTMFLAPSGLIPGEMYWLVIDGSNGSVCGFTITDVSGILDSFDIEPLDPGLTFASDTVACLGYNELHFETGPPSVYAAGYYWVPEWSQDTITTTLPELNLDISPFAPEGMWNVCVRAFNGCDTSNEVCIPILIEGAELQIKDTAVFCETLFPFYWHTRLIPAPGTYLQTFTIPQGCVFDSLWTVYSAPTYPAGLIDTLVCSTSFVYEGTPYSTSGTYLLSYPGAGLYGCDSTAQLNLVIGGLDAFVEFTLYDSIALRSHILFQDSLIDTVTYAWYDCGFDTLLSTEQNLPWMGDGCYCLVLDSGYCRDTICSTYTFGGAMTCDLVDDYACINEEALFIYPDSIPTGATLHWYLDFYNEPDLYFQDLDTLRFSFDGPHWINVSATIVGPSGTYTCHDAIDIPPLEQVTLCCDQELCDTCAFITFHPIHPDYIISFTAEPALGTVEGTFEGVKVCPPSGIPVTYQFSITSAFCQAAIVGDTAITILLHEEPDVSIMQNLDTLFAWPDVQADYAWHACGDTQVLADTYWFTPEASGCYCAEVAIMNGCIDTVCIDFIISDVHDIRLHSLSIYPNPSNGTFRVRTPPGIPFPIYWQLQDALGRLVQKGILYEHDHEIGIDKTIGGGLYYMQLSTSLSEKETHKVVLQE